MGLRSLYNKREELVISAHSPELSFVSANEKKKRSLTPSFMSSHKHYIHPIRMLISTPLNLEQTHNQKESAFIPCHPSSEGNNVSRLDITIAILKKRWLA